MEGELGSLTASVFPASLERRTFTRFAAPLLVEKLRLRACRNTSLRNSAFFASLR